MKSNLINDLDDFGVWENYYDSFFEERAKLVSKETSKRIIKQKIKIKEQPELKDDYEENTTVSE
jgi:hypothetical protein